MNNKLTNDEEIFQSLLDMTATEGEINDILSDIEETESSYEAYDAISNCIKACGGVSKSLELMFGENFSSAASMEVESITAKQGFFGKIVQWIKDFFAKLWAWFKSWFQTRDGMIKKLTELKEKADYVKYPIIIPNYFHALLKAGMGAALMEGVAKVANLTEEYMDDINEADAHARSTPETLQERAEMVSDPSKRSTYQAVVNTATDIATGSWSRISHKWEYIKAHLSIDAIVGSQGNYEIKTPGGLRAETTGLIAELKLSKKISENYGKIHDAWKSVLEADNAFFPGIQAKSMVIYVWKENQKFFRALLRYSNLILQRAEVGNTPVAGAGSSGNPAPSEKKDDTGSKEPSSADTKSEPGNKPASDDKKDNSAPKRSAPAGKSSSSDARDSEFQHGAYWEKQDGTWVPVAEGNLKHE